MCSSRSCSLDLDNEGYCGPNMVWTALSITSKTVGLGNTFVYHHSNISWLIRPLSSKEVASAIRSAAGWFCLDEEDCTNNCLEMFRTLLARGARWGDARDGSMGLWGGGDGCGGC